MNLPNALTLSRIALTGILVFFLEQATWWGNILALIIFIMASLTDFYDGFLAKRQGLVSDFGKIMDPIADKILILSTFWVLAHLSMVPWWMFAVIAVREVLVTLSRLHAIRSKGQVLAAERAGKIKTVTQISAISVTLLYLVMSQSNFCSAWFARVQWLWFALIQLLLWLAVILTVYSGIEYFRNKPRL